MSQQSWPGWWRCRYRILERLGESRDTCILLVEDRLRDCQRMVLKTLRPERSSPESVERLKSEFQLLAGMTHPNVARAYDFGVASEGTDAGFTLEFIDGINVLEACQRGDLPRVLSLFTLAASGLDHLHRMGLVHGDVKPQHILVSWPEGQSEGLVKWIDLGLACRTGRAAPFLPGGTPPYIAPEVAHGHPADPRSDIYSFGVVFHQALTARFPDAPPGFLPETAKWSGVRMPSPGLPRPLKLLLARMTAAAVGDRPGSLREVMELLRRTDLPGASEAAGLVPYPVAGSLPLVGREASIAAFREEMERRAGRPRRGGCLILEGEAGIGKSRVAEAWRIRGELAGLTCISVSFGPAGRSTYWPFQETLTALRRLEGEVRAARLREATEGPALAPLAAYPELRSAYGLHPLHRGWQALSTELLGAWGKRPGLMIFENLHEADPEGLGLWGLLARRLPGHLLLVGTCRTGEDSPNAVNELVADLEREGVCRRVPLGRLTWPEVALLLEAALGETPADAEHVQALQELTGGNPLYVAQWLAHALERQVASTALVRPTLPTLLGRGLPAPLRETLRKRLTRLTEQEQSCVSAMAVIHRSVTEKDLAYVTRMGEGDVRAGLRGLCARGILRATGWTPGDYEFVHSELRLVAYEDLGHRWRQDLHQRAGELEEALHRAGHGVRLADLAEHFLHSRKKLKATEYSLAAGRAAVRARSFEGAARYFRAALDLLHPEVRAYWEAAEELAWVCILLRRDAEAAAWYERLIERTDEPWKKGNFWRKLGAARTSQGEYAKALEAFDNAESLLRNYRGTKEWLRLRVCQFDTLSLQGRSQEAVEGLKGLLTEGFEKDKALLGHVYEYLGRATCQLGCYEESLDWFEKALAELRDPGDEPEKARIRSERAHVAYLQGRYADARASYASALEVQKQHGLRDQVGRTLRGLANLAYIEGDLESSERDNLEALRLFTQAGRKLTAVGTLNALAMGRLRQGRFQSARELLEEALKLGSDLSPQATLQARVSRVSLALAMGDGPAARTELAGVQGLLRDVAVRPYWRVQLAHLEGWLEADHGDWEKGYRLLEEYRGLAEELKMFSEVSGGWAELARVLPPEDARAREYAQKALDSAREIGHAVRQAEAALVVASIHYAQNDPDRAVPVLMPCLEICRKAGLRDLSWRVQAILAACYQARDQHRYTAFYDGESLAVLRDLRTEFPDEEAWRSFLRVAGRVFLYRDLSSRIGSRTSQDDSAERKSAGLSARTQ